MPDASGRTASTWPPPGPSTGGTPYGAQAPNQGWGGYASPGIQQPGPYSGSAYPPPAYQASGYPAPRYQAPPKPGVIPLRPLGLGEILDGAFQACRRNPVATFGSAILLQAVVALATVLLFGNILSSLEVFESQNPAPEDLIGAFAGFGVAASVAGVVSGVALLILQGILVIPVARAVINQRTSFGQAWRLARGRFLPLIGFGLLSFAAGLVGFLLLAGISVLAIAGLEDYSALVIVPLVLGVAVVLVWASTKLVVAPAALMLEGTGPWTSIKRSWQLTRGNWWRTFGIVLLTSIIVSIIASVISMPLTFAVSLLVGFSSAASSTPDALSTLPLVAATQAITALFTAIGYAFQAGVTSLLYVDLRMRREGFDVVLLREHEQAGAGRTDVLPGGTTSFGHRPGGPA
ncbi:glycerophosphoryl diester phosphodiesterase membrane domain-containing protein [Arthrobacter sedimenti]|uniref:glycerophosphoryl diester phosphodiesterase membrane domain-containing protein n=1 Tax=Arthrobacter sedimenti TaxID=2694931 RepID=UPI000B35DEE5|nr:glycerophosphoryl diester phosphodiesterase membrane domain-containing protein [Arthrobacter sedimenti]